MENFKVRVLYYMRMLCIAGRLLGVFVYSG